MLKRSIFCAISRRSLSCFSGLSLMMPRSASAACWFAVPAQCHATEAADARPGVWSRCSDDLLHRTWMRASGAAQCASARGVGAQCARTWMNWGRHGERDERRDDAHELLQEVKVGGWAPGPKGGIPGVQAVATLLPRSKKHATSGSCASWRGCMPSAGSPPPVQQELRPSGLGLSLHHRLMTAHVPN